MKRNFHYGENKAQRQARWMNEFSDAVIAAALHLAGKIEWDSANHYFHSGQSASDAAALYVANRA